MTYTRKKQPLWFVDALEARQLFAAVYPTDMEQYLVELINRARANPSAEASRYDIALNEGLASGTISTAPSQPLAINPFLTDAARDHSRWMINNDVFSHTGAGGSDPGDRMGDAGYVFTPPWTWGENLAYRSFGGSSPTASITAQLHEDLFVDSGYPGRGHRVNILSNDFREIGPGIVSGDFDGFNVGMLTTDFAATGSDVFFTGVAYDDSVNDNDFYTPGEGLVGITIQAVRTSDAAVFATTTWSSGGYSLKLPPGTYTVTGSGALLGQTVTYGSVVIGSENVKRDFYPGAGGSVLAGKVFNDLNGNGKKETGERTLANRRVFADADDDGRLDGNEATDVTDADGRYSITVPAGTHHVRQVLPTGWRWTTSKFHTATVGAGESAVVKSFGATKKVLISGFVFDDADGDALRETGEAGLANWRVYIDEDRDGLFDAEEESVLTDANGKYSLTALPAGTYRVRLVSQGGWSRTTVPSHTVTLEDGETATNLLFGVRQITW
jgi:uncharacterized protein YkwD